MISNLPGSFIIIILLASEVLFAQQSSRVNTSPGQFKAAVVKKDITPDDSQVLVGYDVRKSTGVSDRIFHRIVAFDDGYTQFFLVSSDICLFSPSLYDDVAAKLYTQYKIDPVNFWWTVTHTHSAPEVGPPGLDAVYLSEPYHPAPYSNYTTLVVQKLIDGILEARNKLAPAHLGVGWGFSQANINRRAVDVDGKVSLGLNPDGAVDRRIGLLRIDNENGNPLALIANYPIHGTVLREDNLLISGDAPGIVSEYVEKQTGVPVLFINGAAGDLAPIYSVYPNVEEGHLTQFRVLLGDKILDAYKKIKPTMDEVKLRSAELIMETQRKAGLGWTSEMNYNLNDHF